MKTDPFILRYGSDDGLTVRCSVPVYPMPDPPRYSRSTTRTKARYSKASNLDAGTQDLIKAILEAIEATDVFQWVRKQIDGARSKELKPATPPAKPYLPIKKTPQDKASDSALELEGQQAKYRRIEDSDDERLLYARGTREHRNIATYSRRYDVHNDVIAAEVSAIEGRRDLANQALDFALQHGCTYEAGLQAVGGSLPAWDWVPSSVV